MAIRNLTGKDPNYDFIISLGQGGFGSVAKVRRTSDGKIMACKAIDCSPNPLILEYAHREVKTWAAFADSEKYIANFGRDVAWTERTKTIRLYMDYYEGGDLQRVIDRCKHEDTLIHPFIATYWAMEVARGVKSCHDHGIIHRDLKPANVLLAMPYKYNEVLWAASEANVLTVEQKTLATEFLNWLETRPSWCHITDFGLGKFSAAAMASGRHSLASYGPLGTPGFMAPEVLGADPRFSIKSDVYSLGCLIYSLATCRLPGSQLGSAFARTPELPTDYPVRMRRIVARCLSKEPVERPNSREVANEISEAFMDMMEHEKFGQMRAKLSSNNVPNHRQYANKSSEELDDFLRDAVYRGDVETMTALIGAGANVNTCAYDQLGLNSDWSPRSPYSNEALEAAKDLTEKAWRTFAWWRGDSLKTIPLVCYAAAQGSVASVYLLLSNKARYDRRKSSTTDPIIAAAGMGNTEVVNDLIRNWQFDPHLQNSYEDGLEGLLHQAAKSCNPSTVKTLLDRGCNPYGTSRFGETPLMKLSRISPWHVSLSQGTSWDAEALKRLDRCYRILLQAAPDLITKDQDPASSGATILWRCIEASQPFSIIQLLLERGASPPKGVQNYYEPRGLHNDFSYLLGRYSAWQQEKILGAIKRYHPGWEVPQSFPYTEEDETME